MKYLILIIFSIQLSLFSLLSQDNPTNRKAFVCKECKYDVFIGNIDVCNKEKVRENLVSYYWYNSYSDANTGKEVIRSEYLFKSDGSLMMMDKSGNSVEGKYTISTCKDTLYKSYGAQERHKTKFVSINISLDGKEMKLPMIGDDYAFMRMTGLTIKIGRPDQSIINKSIATSKIKEEKITFTQIYIDEEEGQSAVLAYKDSSGEERYDLVFSGNIIIGGQTLFGFEDGILMTFNQDLANVTIGKEIILKYTLVDQAGYPIMMVKSLEFVDPSAVSVKPVLIPTAEGKWKFSGNGISGTKNYYLNMYATSNEYRGNLTLTSSGKQMYTTGKQYSIYGQTFFVFDVSAGYATYFIAFEKDGILKFYSLKENSIEKIAEAFSKFKNSEEEPHITFKREN